MSVEHNEISAEEGSSVSVKCVYSEKYRYSTNYISYLYLTLHFRLLVHQSDTNFSSIAITIKATTTTKNCCIVLIALDVFFY